ncbi:MAG: PadR family transcriptional regulator [Candidatus Marinimicrobia bacterium]|nr:PadR family transcriptional regulator [Candidatus Neomarinimicrobiota bacterium]
MSSIDIIVLGVLMKGSQSAYHINKTLERNHVGDWLKISEPAVYRNIRKLCANGYLSDHSERDGARPEKRVYTITSQGRKRLLDLIHEASQSPVRINCSFDAYIAHLNYVGHDEGAKLIRSLKQNISQRQQEMAAIMKAAEPGLSLLTKSVIDLRMRYLRTAQEWVEDLYDYYLGNQVPYY